MDAVHMMASVNRLNAWRLDDNAWTGGDVFSVLPQAEKLATTAGIELRENARPLAGNSSGRHWHILMSLTVTISNAVFGCHILMLLSSK